MYTCCLNTLHGQMLKCITSSFLLTGKINEDMINYSAKHMYLNIATAILIDLEIIELEIYL